jgi:hypothetical protein
MFPHGLRIPPPHQGAHPPGWDHECAVLTVHESGRRGDTLLIPWMVVCASLNDAVSVSGCRMVGRVPITVAARSQALTAFVRSNTGIMGSNPTQGMDIWCVYAIILCLCCLVFR